MAKVGIVGQCASGDSGGGLSIVTYKAMLPLTSSVETDLTLPDFTQIVQVCFYLGSGLQWSFFTEDYFAWLKSYSGAEQSLPATLYTNPYLRLVSINGNVIRYASSIDGYISAVGYFEEE